MLKRKLDYLKDISEKVKILHKEGFTIEDIREELFPTRYGIIDVFKGEWDSLHIVSSILKCKEGNCSSIKPANSLSIFFNKNGSGAKASKYLQVFSQTWTY
ncbi:hypothetical protein [Metabacillus rhizolycopersici]|uniref:Uncharacterized protein n=1 Tax=Metabacillus rhizolycopersici TaxID=2875709 RepID=A0ABS7UY47_9BACI|nr:hypothetical protein [Metabacillus rhizolycopersici]MBZ5752954.1 hypothetical protein [Metabacillus rhizolycopersici]